MGVCLCKDKVDENQLNDPASSVDGVDNVNVRSLTRGDRVISLSETVDRLVRETLEVIGSIVDK